VDPDWEVWYTFKTRTRNLIITHSTRLSVNRKIHTAHLLRRLNFFHKINDTQPGCASNKIDKITVELQAESDFIREGNLIRSKLQQVENCENSAAFYKRTETHNSQKSI
jgi:hypothetical protein